MYTHVRRDGAEEEKSIKGRKEQRKEIKRIGGRKGGMRKEGKRISGKRDGEEATSEKD